MDRHEALDVARLADEVFAERWDDSPGPATLELRTRHGDVLAATRTLLAAGDAEAAARITGALLTYWQATGAVGEGREVAEVVLGHTPGEPPAVWGRAWLTEGVLAFRQGDQGAASNATRRAAAIAEGVGDDPLLAEAETNLARIAFREGDARLVLRHADRVEALSGGDPNLLTKAVHMRAWGLYTAGDVAGAIAEFARNVEGYEALGRHVDAASERANIADLAAEAGDLDTAVSRLHEAMSTPGVADDGYLVPSLVLSAAVLVGRAGEPASAHLLFAAADALYAGGGIVPDPGDHVSDAARAEVREALDDRTAADLASRGRALGAAEALSAARAALSTREQVT